MRVGFKSIYLFIFFSFLRRFHRIQLCSAVPEKPRRSSRVNGISKHVFPSTVPVRILEGDETGLEVCFFIESMVREV